MSRQARVISETGYYHIIMRGNNKDTIFKREQDKEYFLEYLKQLESEGLIAVVTWCLMDNHVHLVVKAEPDALTIAFKRLNIKYAMMYHREHKTVGHVFQDRYKSEPIETDETMLLVTRYIHQNPVKAKMIKAIETYKWSSYQRYLNKNLTESMAYVKGLFNNSNAEFEQFHKVMDNREYMEIKEDQLKYREERSQRIITDCCNKYGIVDAKEIHGNKEILEEIVKEMIESSGMSLRKIAEFIGVSFSTVQLVSKKQMVEKNRS